MWHGGKVVAVHLERGSPQSQLHLPSNTSRTGASDDKDNLRFMFNRRRLGSAGFDCMSKKEKKMLKVFHPDCINRAIISPIGALSPAEEFKNFSQNCCVLDGNAVLKWWPRLGLCCQACQYQQWHRNSQVFIQYFARSQRPPLWSFALIILLECS